MPRTGNFIEIGKVAYAVSGPAKGKLCVIVDIIDQNRALVDGPFTGVCRQEYQLSRLQVTKFRIKIRHGQRTKYVKKGWKAADIEVKWSQCLMAQKLKAKKVRDSLTDFDRFKVGYLKQIRNRLVRQVARDLVIKKKEKVAKKLNPIERDYYLKQEAIRIAKREAKIKELGSVEEYKKYLKEVVPKLRKEFQEKASATKKEEHATLKDTLSKCGRNGRLREEALSKYARTSSGRVRFNRDGKMVLKESLPEDFVYLTRSTEEKNEIKKERVIYIKEKAKKLKETQRLKKKANRKKISILKRRFGPRKKVAA